METDSQCNDSTLHASPPPKAEDLSVQTLIVICGCSDGKTRAVAFDDKGKQAKQVHGFIRHIQGGGLKLHKEPVALVQLDESKAPTIRPNETQPEGGPSIRARVSAMFARFRRSAALHPASRNPDPASRPC